MPLVWASVRIHPLVPTALSELLQQVMSILQLAAQMLSSAELGIHYCCTLSYRIVNRFNEDTSMNHGSINLPSLAIAFQRVISLMKMVILAGYSMSLRRKQLMAKYLETPCKQPGTF